MLTWAVESVGQRPVQKGFGASRIEALEARLEEQELSHGVVTFAHDLTVGSDQPFEVVLTP